jgi:hypothetical protein
MSRFRQSRGSPFGIPRRRVSMIVRPSGATLGFSDQAHLDEAHMWPTPFALKELPTILCSSGVFCSREYTLRRPLLSVLVPFLS